MFGQDDLYCGTTCVQNGSYNKYGIYKYYDAKYLRPTAKDIFVLWFYLVVPDWSQKVQFSMLAYYWMIWNGKLNVQRAFDGEYDTYFRFFLMFDVFTFGVTPCQLLTLLLAMFAQIYHIHIIYKVHWITTKLKWITSFQD